MRRGLNVTFDLDFVYYYGTNGLNLHATNMYTSLQNNIDSETSLMNQFPLAFYLPFA